MPRSRLPAAPLQRVLLRLRAGQSLTWDQLADQAGVSSRHLFRLLAARDLSEQVADRITCRLGLHPALLWPTQWLRAERVVRGRCRSRNQQTG
jgi:transcriptional regulator GlxA family with amidase domain